MVLCVSEYKFFVLNKKKTYKQNKAKETKENRKTKETKRRKGEGKCLCC